MPSLRSERASRCPAPVLDDFRRRVPWLVLLGLFWSHAEANGPLFDDGYDTTSPSWTVADSDASPRLIGHGRVPEAARRGDAGERIVVDAATGTRLRIQTPVGPAAAIDELVAAIWLRCNRADVRIAADYPLVAERLDRFSVIRSLVSREGDHERGTHAVRTGYRPDPTVVHPSLGAVTAQQSPVTGLDIPPYIALGSDGFPGRGGYLGGRFDPYRVFVPGLAGQNLEPAVRGPRQDRRLTAVRGLDAAFAAGRGVPVRESLHDHTLDAAVALMSSEQLAAFSVTEEPAEVRDRYGDTPFGRGCLVARRLIEAGVRSVDVTLQGFDTHAANFTGHAAQAVILDRAVAALVDDLAARDLAESTVVLVAGEFGRTPKINPLDGRDHWPHGFSCLLTGGGIVPGRVIGETDPQGESRTPTDPVTVADLAATVLAALGIDWQRELVTPIGRPLKLAEGTPVKGLVKG